MNRLLPDEKAEMGWNGRSVGMMGSTSSKLVSFVNQKNQRNQINQTLHVFAPWCEATGPNFARKIKAEPGRTLPGGSLDLIRGFIVF